LDAALSGYRFEAVRHMPAGANTTLGAMGLMSL
jgi:hypothetical protein